MSGVIDIDALWRAMAQEGINQSELGRRIGVSRASVSRIMRGQRAPSARFVAGLRAAFPGRSLEEFLFPVRRGDAHKCHSNHAGKEQAS